MPNPAASFPGPKRISLWGLLFLTEAFLLGRYGTDGPAGALLVIWILTGWLWSGVYCSIVALISRARARKRADPKGQVTAGESPGGERR